MKKEEKFVLDSFALLAFFQKEPGWKFIQKLFYRLAQQKKTALFNWINWGEFYYIINRRLGSEKSQDALDLIENLPVQLVPIDFSMVKNAAEIKSAYPLSLADSFCISTALRHNAVIITGDPEFREAGHIVTIKWLPSLS